jgi:hypothetical protein
MSQSRESRALLDEFYHLLDDEGGRSGIHASLWAATGRLGDNLFRLAGALNVVLYVKVRTEPPPFWGLTANRLQLLRESKKHWAVVLLFEKPSYGFVFTPAEIERNIKNSLWRLASDGDYKVHEKDVAGRRPFKSLGELLAALGKASPGTSHTP